ncbi:mitochondrial 18kDa protein [Gorgonomyces haynaldii]|nr:mitochondrial 18kDa protein [Gorgonomyces haynaldii]
MSEDQLDEFRDLAYLARLRNLVRVGYRYLAFTSDVGEAVRPVVPLGIVNLAYGISFAYVGADVAYHTAWTRDKTSHLSNSQELVTRQFLERSVFQGLASLFLPAVTIHTLVDQTAKILKRQTRNASVLRWGPSLTGLAFLPLLPTLLDEPTEYVVETVFDKLWPTDWKPHHH